MAAAQCQATPAATSTKLEEAYTILSCFVNKEKAYTLKALALAGVFYFFNHPKISSISRQYLAPSPALSGLFY